MIAPGTSIGPYSIQQQLGAGGMGVVYLATDTRLDRRVAIKALPAHLAADPDRLARFQREAKLLASLNHANIGAIYGLEESGDHRYLILEYIEGETLAERLKQGPIPTDEALQLARQVAEAVEAAHDKGIVHRDLKPGNVILTPDGAPKVLDFGLARTADAAPSTAPVNTDSPTLTTPHPAHSPTIPGVIMGTAGYMSPEQARGKPVDKRSDIFSFGCVLYEMLTGAQPFPGETATDSIGAILHREPDWNLLPANVPLRVRELLASCLTKDRKHRLHDIGDARLILERPGHAEAAPSAGRRTTREVLAWSLAALALAAGLGSLLLRPARGPGNQPILQFTIPAPPGTALNPESVNSKIAPNGRSVLFIASAPSGPTRIWVRDFDSIDSRPLEGTEGAVLPFWSPDSESIAFFSGGALCRIAARGGPVQRIADAPGPRGGDWSETGVILFAPSPNGPLYVVPQSGGDAQPALELNTAENETGQRFPQFLPGGKKFLFASVMRTRREMRGNDHTKIGSLDSRSSTVICSANARATFVNGGWLLIDRAGTLYVQKFDPATGALSDQEFPTILRPSGQVNYTGAFTASCSTSGVAGYVINGLAKSDCVEIGANGQIIRTVSGKPEVLELLRLSPNSEYLAAIASPIRNTSEVRLFDLARDVSSRLVDDSNVTDLCWSPDSQSLYYSSDRASRDIFRLAIIGAKKPELVHVTGNFWASVRDVSTGGRYVLFNSLDPTTQRDMWILDTTTQAVRTLSAETCNDFSGRLSPDENLLAIATDESGRPELYVQAFPGPGPRARVSLSGLAVSDAGTPSDGIYRWSSDGSSLLYLDADRRTVRKVPVTAAPALRAGKPETLLQLPPGLGSIEIGPEGKSVFATMPAQGQPPCSIAITMNWLGEVKAGAPSKN